MRVMLINPPMQVEENHKGKIEIYQPTGLLYLAASLEKAGFEVNVLDAVIEDYLNERVIECSKFIGMDFSKIGIATKGYDIIGITGMMMWKDSIEKTIYWIKLFNPRATIICGGPYASWHPEECIKMGADYAIVGEGEQALAKVIMDKPREKIIKADPTNELDSLPFPARHLIDMEAYFKAAGTYKYSRIKQKGTRAISVITGRGCPFNCVFCSAHILSGRVWRARSYVNIMEEINQAAERYAITDVYFEDENMSLNKERMQKLMILLKPYKLRLHANQGLRADTLDRYTLELMKDAGFKEVTIAPETGSQRVMDEIIDKRLKLTDIERVAKDCKDMGMKLYCFFVIGMPGETALEIEQTLAFAKKLRREYGVLGCTVKNAMPVIGTRLYNEAKRQGCLLKDGKELEDMMYGPGVHVIRTPEWEANYVEFMYRKAQEDQKHDQIRNPAYLKEVAMAAIRHPEEAIRRLG